MIVGRLDAVAGRNSPRLAPVSTAARWSGLASGPSWARAMATVSRFWGQVGSRDKAWTFSDRLPYGRGACVGRGSVVGDGAGVTVCTEGPALVSPTRLSLPG